MFIGIGGVWLAGECPGDGGGLFCIGSVVCGGFGWFLPPCASIGLRRFSKVPMKILVDVYGWAQPVSQRSESGNYESMRRLPRHCKTQVLYYAFYLYPSRQI